MALHGWRLFGVAGTVFAYIAGILFLSVMNMQNPHPRRPRLGRFGEINSIRNRDISGLNRRQPIQWCTELKFLDGNPINLHHHRKKPLTKSVFDPFAGRKNFVIRYKKIFKLSSDTRNSIKTTEINSVVGGKNEQSSGKEEQQLDRPQLERTTEKPNQGDPNSKLTALASFPGSGNTWLRYLLQQATGILTGSIYKDYGLLKSGFPAENICNKSVLVVKTHEFGPNAWKQFAKAILLIRDPDKAILAEFNRQSGGHVGFASPDRYKRTRGRYWQQFVGNKLMGWENMNLAWAKNFTGNLKIVYYDDLVADVEGTLREILTFLNFPINEDLLACAIKRKEGIYRRKKRVLPFDPYSPNMKKYLEDKKHNIYKTLGRRT